MNDHLVPPPEPGAPAAIDPRLFRKVMGTFAAGVTVVSLDADGMPRGMTASSFMSGSLEPPLCVVSIAKRAHMHAFMSKTKRFGINILAQGQQIYAHHFAGKPVAGLDPPFRDLVGVPMLSDAIAHIVTEAYASHDCGDHTLFIGHILHMDCDERRPLLYHRSGFGSFQSLSDRQTITVPEFW
jgi:flavin reductase (DIM6/NTAB) family NADH-FMN oxidoreductase RutF